MDIRRAVTHRTRISNALFQEQDRQRKLGMMDATLLGEVCRGYSLLSETEACRRARQLFESLAKSQDTKCHTAYKIVRRRSTLSTVTCEEYDETTSTSASHVDEMPLPAVDNFDEATNVANASRIAPQTNSTKLEVSLPFGSLGRKGKRLARKLFRNNSA